MSLYPYSSLLPGPNSIRLLRLRPPKDETAPMKYQLFNYSLDESDKKPPPYEALSYVWGDPEKTLPIFIDERRFNVTENLHAALRRLRDCSIEWVWVDAICINQRDRQERGHQIRSMAKIYGKANRVVVWLGEAANNSDRAFEEIRARRKGLDFSDNEIIQQAVLGLLQRPWFRRIWILQEVAAARRILITCGSAEIDGYAFCLGLKSLQVFYEAYPDLHNLIRSVTYLIRQANFRPTHGICWSDMSFLAIRPLGELLDMFHTHEATERHDKVYALLGMSSDALNAADLLPDYKVPWGEVFQRLIKFLLYKQVTVETWDDREIAVIKSQGYILGQVSSVVPHSGWGDTHNVDITSNSTAKYLGYTGEWSARLTLHTSAKSIQQGDLVYLLQGAPQPTIIRRCKDFFTVIMIAVTPPQHIRMESGNIRWSELLHSSTVFLRDFLLIWDWAKSPERPQGREEYETLLETDGRVREHSKAELKNHLDKAARLWDVALILQDLEEYEEAEESHREAMKSYERAFKKVHPETLSSIASTYGNQGRWREAEELEVQVVEIYKRVLGKEHPDTLISMANLASTYSGQGRWKKAEELEVQVMETSNRVLGEEHLNTLISTDYLALTYRDQGRWREAEELFIYVIETCKRVLGKEHPSTLTIMANLASTYGDQGRWREAEELFIYVIETCKRVLGKEHPSTLAIMAHFMSTYRDQGRWREAEELDMQVMEISKEHPDAETLNKWQVEESMGKLLKRFWRIMST